MSAPTSGAAQQKHLTFRLGFLLFGALLLPGTLMVARETYLNAYGQYSLNIHNAPALALACILSFFGMCVWEALGVVLLSVAAVRRQPVHVGEILALIAGATLVGVPLLISI